MQNGFAESFNGRMRDELLNETMFRNLAHARVVITAWATDYNTERPHSALDYQTPANYARTLTTAIARPAARDESSARRAFAQPSLKLLWATGSTQMEKRVNSFGKSASVSPKVRFQGHTRTSPIPREGIGRTRFPAFCAKGCGPMLLQLAWSEEWSGS